MKNYIEELNPETRKYFSILSSDFPEFLNDYIYTKQMQKLAGVNQICGRYWRKENIYDDLYSVLRHSVAVALIIWNFTHDKKQALAGLFHDISSPAFKHCLDFLNGDAEKQESTEKETEETIKNSAEIMLLLERDNIKLEEVSDYKIYTLADNDTPKLSADRLEYTFMNGIYNETVWDLKTIADIYNDLEVLENEYGEKELGFKTISIAEKFITCAKDLWPIWIDKEDIITMYFFASIIQRMYNKKYLTKEDLYNKSEQEIIFQIKTCEDKNISKDFEKFMACKDIIESDEEVKDKFCASRKVKRRYINPLTKQGRIYNVSKIAKKFIDDYKNMKISKYAYIDI